MCKSPPPKVTLITHFFTYFNQLGGVESWLKLHQVNGANFGVDESFVLVFEPETSSHHNVYTLGQTGLHSVFTARRRFRKIAGNFTGNVHVYHNLWGLTFLADLDRSSKRVGTVHSQVDDIARSLISGHHYLDLIFTVSNTLRNWVMDLIPDFPAGKIEVLPNPIGVPATFRSAKAPRTEKIVLGYSGRVLKELKRIDRLPLFLNALDELKLDYEFHVIGDGNALEWLRSKVGRHPRLVTHGRMEGTEYYKCLSALDALVFFSDVEGLPMSLIEGFSLGIPSFFPRIDSEAVVLARNIAPSFVYPVGQMERLAKQVTELFTGKDRAMFQKNCEAQSQPFALRNHYQCYMRSINAVNHSTRAKTFTVSARKLSLRDFVPFGLMRRLHLSIQ